MSTAPVAVITGGEGALGTAMRRTFAERGYRVASFDIVADPGAGLPEDGGNTLRAVVDVSSADAVDAAIGRVVEAFGGIDVLVNNAGLTSRTDTATLALDEWQTVIATHLTGTFFCSRAAYPALRSSDRAAVVNISSVLAHLGLPRRAAYSAAKAGIEGLTRCLAAEWAPDGIRVNAIAPGYIRTPHHEEMFARGILSESLIQSRTLLGDLGLPADIAAAAAFLASPEARFITGQTMVVDGGLTISGGIDAVPEASAASIGGSDGG